VNFDEVFNHLKERLNWSTDKLNEEISKLIEEKKPYLTKIGAIMIIAKKNNISIDHIGTNTNNSIDHIGTNTNNSLNNILTNTNNLLTIHHKETITYDKIKKVDIANTGIDQNIIDYLQKIHGTFDFYQYQFESYKNIMDGKDVAITSPPGTGKSLAFTLPICNKILKLRKSNEYSKNKVFTVFIFPTNALVRDQYNSLRVLCVPLGISVKMLIGPLTQQQKDDTYSNPPDILLTNFDSIYFHLLRQTRYSSLFNNIKILVIDEMHAYEGIFGSNVRYIINSLQLINKNLQIIAASATIDNVDKFFKKLIDRKNISTVQSMQKDSEMQFIMASPKVSFDEVLIEIGRFCKNESRIFLIFRDAITGTEKLSTKFRKRGIETWPHRSGLKPDEYTQIETALKNRSVQGVICTPTLELGIDIGTIDVVISTTLVPWMNFRQRMGRAGRRDQTGYGVLLLDDDPVSNWYKKRPQDYKSDYPIYINPKNPRVANKMLPFYSLSTSEEKNNLIKTSDPIFQDPLYNEIFNDVSLFEIKNDKVYPKITNIQNHLENYNIRGMGFDIKIYENPTDGFVGPNNQKNHIGSYTSPAAFQKFYEGGIYIHKGTNYVIKETRLNPNDKSKNAEHYAIVEKIKDFQFNAKKFDSQNVKKMSVLDIAKNNGIDLPTMKNRELVAIRVENDVYLLSECEKVPDSAVILLNKNGKPLISDPMQEHKDLWCIPEVTNGYKIEKPHYTTPMWERTSEKNNKDDSYLVKNFGSLKIFYGGLIIKSNVKSFNKYHLYNDKPMDENSFHVVNNYETVNFETKGIFYEFSHILDLKSTSESEKQSDMDNSNRTKDEKTSSFGTEIPKGMHVIEHALRNSGTIICSVSQKDIHGLIQPKHPNYEVVLYDNSDDGESGITEEMFYKYDDVMRRAFEMIKFCSKGCKEIEGCPGCTFVIPRLCDSNHDDLNKHLAIIILERVIFELFNYLLKELKYTDSQFRLEKLLKLKKDFEKLIPNIDSRISDFFGRDDTDDFSTYHDKVP